MRVKLIAFALALGLCMGAVASADQPGPDPLAGAFIPPDFVMMHQQELGLSDHQKTAIQADVQRAQEHFTQAQWQVSAAMEKLASILKQPRVDESQALAQLDSELQHERDIKRTQITLMIRVKNELTPEQQAKAFQLMQASR